MQGSVPSCLVFVLCFLLVWVKEGISSGEGRRPHLLPSSSSPIRPLGHRESVNNVGCGQGASHQCTIISHLFLRGGSGGPHGVQGEGGVDEDHDSLMGIPDPGKGKGKGDAGGELLEQLVGLQRFDPVKAATWPKGESAPLSFVSAQLKVVEDRLSSPDMRHRAQDTLCNLFRTLIVASPADLVSLVCLLRDQVLSPALAGIELIPASVLMKNVADSSGKSLSSVKSAVAAAGGDVAPVAQSLQGSQMRLFQPPRLSFATAFAKMREIALMGGRDVAKKQEQARLLMLAAQGPEILTVVRCLQGTLRRSGYSTSAVVSALAKAVEMHPIESLPRAEIPASADANAQAQPRDGEDEVCVGGAEEIEGIIHEALSHVPSLERVVAALLEKGPRSLMAALGVTVRRGAGTRARKAKQAAFQNLRDDIEFEMAEEGWLHASGLEQGAKEIELEELKAASAAAVLSGLSPRHLTSHEEMVLPPALAQDSARAVALRNHILLRHRRHTLSSLEYQPLTEEQACAGVDLHNVEDFRAVFESLCSLGYINQVDNLIPQAMPAPSSTEITKPRVVVVGAGFAGVCTARSLLTKGFQVVVVEASSSVGGRVCGLELGGTNVELGAMAITGSRGNPLYQLARALKADLYTLRGGCTLHAKDGKPLPAHLDSTVEKSFNSFLDAVPTQGRPFPHNDSMNTSVSAQPLSTHTAVNANAMAGFGSDPVDTGVVEGQDEALGREASLSRHSELDGVISMANSEGLSGKGSSGHVGESPPVLSRNSADQQQATSQGEGSSDGSAIIKKMFEKGSLGKAIDAIIEREATKAANGKSKIASAAQWGLAASALAWHCANLEFAIGAPLDNVSSYLWNLDDVFRYSGDDSSIPKGIQSLLDPLLEGMDVKLSHQVSEVDYGGMNGVRVRAVGAGGNEVCLDADYCVVTVPLGVLKDGRPNFSPPLPIWKTSAIQGMGFGLLNKVALVFESVFWGENNPHDYIGFLQDDASERGLCYMFCNLYPATKRPILLALMAGEAAEFAEENGDEQVVAVAMSALRRAFPGASSPVQAHVTRWGSDVNTRGCYSFMARDSKVNHHEALAREVDGRLFFAGEHTSRTHPAQVVGAMLSGVLAAGKVEAYARRGGHSFP